MPTVSRYSREIAPAGHERWHSQDKIEASPFQQLERWLQDVSRHEPVFQRQVYDNPKITQFDVRMHRQRLCALMSIGEELAIHLLYDLKREWTDRENEAFGQLERELARLQETYCDWHGNPANDPTIPKEVLESLAELDRGELEPLAKL